MNKILIREYKKLKKLYTDRLIIYTELRKIDDGLTIKEFMNYETKRNRNKDW